MRQSRILVLLFVALLLLVALPAQAQSGDDLPVVFAVFFYSPTCPHCHDVINEVFPVMADEFGDQFQIIGIDVSVEGSGYYFGLACQIYAIPDEACGSVPLLIIGENDYMLGSAEIPNRAFDLVRDGLEEGGIPVPEFIRADYEAAQAERAGAEATGEAVAAADTSGDGGDASGNPNSAGASEGAGALAVGEIDADRSIADRLAADPAANAVAIAVLALLVLSLGGVIVLGRSGQLLTNRLPRFAALAASIGGLVMGLTLLDAAGDDTLAAVSVYTVIFTLIVTAYFLILPPTRRDMRPFALPLVLVAGLMVAVYLAQVETGDTAAVCGSIGDCNTVQQSEYASLFGVLPVGVLGIIGYVAMLLAWGVTLLNGGKSAYVPLARAALFWMALGGVVFSIYLTFLEPFVIGATCAWCITSALTMLAALWLTAPEGWQATSQVIVDDGDSAVGAPQA